MPTLAAGPLAKYSARLICDSFFEARTALEMQGLAALLPNYLAPDKSARQFFRVRISEMDRQTFQFCLAWNPRLLRLNPHAVRRRDLLVGLLSKAMTR